MPSSYEVNRECGSPEDDRTRLGRGGERRDRAHPRSVNLLRGRNIGRKQMHQCEIWKGLSPRIHDGCHVEDMPEADRVPQLVQDKSREVILERIVPPESRIVEVHVAKNAVL